MEKRLNLRCRCWYFPHQLEFRYNDGLFVVSMLNDFGGFFDRLKTAIRLIFGEVEPYAEVVLNAEDVSQLKRWLDEIPEDFGCDSTPGEPF